MRWLSVPVINPIHADAAYVSRDTTIALKTVLRPASPRPWCRSTRSAYSDCALSLTTRRTWSDADIVSVNVTPSTFSVVPRVISGSGGSGWMRCRRLWQRTVRIKVVDPLCPPYMYLQIQLRHCGDAMCLVVPYFRLCG